MSHTSSCGLVGVSIHSSRAPASASAWALPRVGASRTSMPIFCSQLDEKVLVV
jgi:hypothetical protein